MELDEFCNEIQKIHSYFNGDGNEYFGVKGKGLFFGNFWNEN